MNSQRFSDALSLISELTYEVKTGRLNGRSNAALYQLSELTKAAAKGDREAKNRYKSEVEPGVEFRPAQSAPSVKIELQSREQFDSKAFKEAMKRRYGGAVDADIEAATREVKVRRFHFS